MRADVMGARIQHCEISLQSAKQKPLDLRKLTLINLSLHNNIKETAAKSKREVVMKQATIMSCPPDILSWAAVECSLWNLLTCSSGFL